MRKNKTLAFALAASLLVGGTFVGTKAWFTTSETVDSELVITTGNINLDVDGENVWTSVADNKETPEHEDGTNRFTNVKPGDVFKNTVTITKSGSLNQDITVEGGRIINNDQRFNVQIKDGSDKVIPDLKSKVEEDLNTDRREAISTFTIVVTVTDKMGNADNGQLNPIELSNIIEKLTIDGTQDK